MDSSNQEIVDLSIHYLDLVQCPLNPSHQLRRHKLPYHLIKCRKAYPEKIACPYERYFYADKDKMHIHLQNCTFKPKVICPEESQKIMETQNAIKKNINYNYDVENFTVEEPYWD